MDILKLMLGSSAFDHNHLLRNRSSSDGRDTDNDSLDVLTKNCFTNYDTVACIRGTVLCFLSAVTGFMCAGRIVHLHMAGHPNFYQYAIFYLAVFQCMLGTAEWVVGWTVHAALACSYLRAMQILIICHFYVTMACRVLRKSESIGARLSASALSLFVVYFTSFIIMGYVFANSPWFDCYANYWLFMCTGQLIAIQVLVAAAVLILLRVNAVTAQESLKRSQKRALCLLIIAFELSALVSISYHLTLFFLANEDIGCSGVFLHDQLVYTPVRIVHELFVTLLPIWVMLYVFQPMKRFNASDQQLLISATQSSDGSINNDPSLYSNSVGRHSRRRRMQINHGTNRTLLPDALPYNRRSFRVPRRLRQCGKPINLRRSTSAPSFGRKMATPPLATIPEETGSQHSSETGSVQNSPPTSRLRASYSEGVTINENNNYDQMRDEACFENIRSM